jgi:hypothetical protein
MKIFIVEKQPDPIVHTKKNTSGKGPENWVNTTFLFQQDKDGPVLSAWCRDDKKEFIKENFGKEIEVESVKENAQFNNWIVNFPKASGGKPFTPYAKTGGYDNYRGDTHTMLEYVKLVTETYDTFFDHVVSKVASSPISIDDVTYNIMETAQQLTVQAIIAVQKNMVHFAIGDKQPDEGARLIVAAILQRVAKHNDGTRKLTTQEIDTFLGKVRESDKLTVAQKTSLQAELVALKGQSSQLEEIIEEHELPEGEE